MIFELLTEIRPLSGHNRIYDSYLHAIETMALLARRRVAVNNRALILAGLLHEVEDKLGPYKLLKCLEIIDKHHPKHQLENESTKERTVKILNNYKNSEKLSKADWSTNLLQSGCGTCEELFLADRLSEAQLTNSNVILFSITNGTTDLIKKKLLQADDERVIDILKTTKRELVNA